MGDVLSKEARRAIEAFPEERVQRIPRGVTWEFSAPHDWHSQNVRMNAAYRRQMKFALRPHQNRRREEARARWAALVETGMSISEMSAQLGVRRDTVRDALKRYDLTPLKADPAREKRKSPNPLRERLVVSAHEGGATITEAARLAGCSYEQVRTVSRRIGLVWTTGRQRNG